MTKAGHTSIKTGAKAIVLMRDGTHIIGKFIERKGRFIVLDNARLNVADVRTVSYYRAADQVVGGEQ